MTTNMGDKVPGTNITYGEVYGIGAALLNWVTTVGRLGHTSPASTLDYTSEVSSLSALIVRDFVAWSSGRLDTVPGDPEQRLRELVAEADWERMLLDGFDAVLEGRAS